MSRISNLFDSWLSFLKWPVGIVFVLWLPNVALALVRVVTTIIFDMSPMLPFLGGAIFWGILWWAFLRRTRYTFFLTLEHELTHAIFAWLTFHKVTDLRVTLTRGGQISHQGVGNWLIALAPYFWPTLSLVLMLIVWLLPAPTHAVGEALIGMSFAWHVTSTIRETHPKQTDIAKAGKLFSLMFLPAANMLTIGSLLAFAHGGAERMSGFLLDALL